MSHENREPLASQIRPKTLDEFVGQTHLAGAGKPASTRGGEPTRGGPLRVAIEKKELFSFILWGPPGSGKTTLARIYANALEADFYELSAVDSGKEDIKKIVDRGRQPRLALGKPKVLFIDEIHRFNRAQQDFLLPYVERGDITLIGATTENPSFEVIAPLLSRCRVFVLNEHSEEEMKKIIARTKIRMPKAAIDWLIQMAGGDARQAITTLETAQKLYEKITVETLKEAIQSRHLRYDKKGEEHYNTISAFIKSMRAGQADSALYYLARMVDAGEDPKFIARRMVIFASEDVGLAQPTALVVANAVFEAVNKIGYPEAMINLAHGAAYLAQCKKDRRAYDGVFAALDDVKKHGNLPIPLRVRNLPRLPGGKAGAPTKLMKELGYHKGYKMYNDESYLPDALKKKKYLKG